MEIGCTFDHADRVRGRTQLWEAASQGATVLVDNLVARRADVTAQTSGGHKKGDGDGTTPLGIAVRRQRYDVVKRLLDAGADKNNGREVGRI